MENKQNIKIVSISTLGSFSALKLPYNKIDPYTRAAIGLITGLGMFVLSDENYIARWSGFGIALGGLLTLEEIGRIKGGKITSNNYNNPVYCLHETKGIIELQPNQIPDFRIDGLTIKGLHGIVKARDGVYLNIDSSGSINTNFGFGMIVNKIGGGFKNKSWVDGIGDSRWKLLYEKSI